MSDRKPIIVTQVDELAEHVACLEQTGWFAFDTEFVGEDSYEPQVCLIQTATDEVCGLIDPLDGLDLMPFWKLVLAPTVRKIVHAGGQDLALCGTIAGRPSANVIDLQVAAGLLGYGYPLSLARLAMLTLKKRIHKSQTLTDWRRRPLNNEQINYAMEDVIHLPRIFRQLERELESRGRMDWVVEDCDRLCRQSMVVTQDRLEVRRLKGIASLRPREQALAHALLATRDLLARELNRPARVVLKDHLLIEIARHGWTDVNRIRTLRGINLPAFALKRIAEAAEHAKREPSPMTPVEREADIDKPEEETLLALLTAVLRDLCIQEKINFALMATKGDLRQCIRSFTRGTHPDGASPLMIGWRKKLVGERLERLLQGRSAVRVVRQADAHRLIIQD